MKFDFNSILPPNQTYHGMSYGDWAATWWNWLFSDQEQVGSVFFLRGNVDLEQGIVRVGKNGPIVYSDTAIFFPVICTITSELTNPLATTEMIRRKISSDSQREPSILSLSVNNIEISGVTEHYTESPEFVLDIQKSSPILNYFEPTPRMGKAEAVAAGYWFLIKPLPLGNYRLEFEGRHKDGFRSTGSYEIKVVKRPPFY